MSDSEFEISDSDQTQDRESNVNAPQPVAAPVVAAPVKKPRGRPRKTKLPTPLSIVIPVENKTETKTETSAQVSGRDDGEPRRAIAGAHKTDEPDVNAALAAVPAVAKKTRKPRTSNKPDTNFQQNKVRDDATLANTELIIMLKKEIEELKGEVSKKFEDKDAKKVSSVQAKADEARALFARMSTVRY